MHILHVDTGAEMRGGQHQVMLLMDGLRSAGHESTLLAREQSPLWQKAGEAGFRTLPAESKELWRTSREAAVVHAHDARAHTLAAIASRRKFVVSRRVAFPVRRSVASLWKYRRATRFLAVSRFVANELEAAGIRQEKIDVVYDGVETPEIQVNWSPDNPILALASEDPQKGRDLVEQAAGQAGVSVVFSHNIPRDLTRASIFVYISRSEGLGSAALLAMSVGVPVIASAIGGLTELFVDGISGILVPNNIDEIAAAIRQLLDHADSARSLGEHGRQRVAECFTKEHLVRGTLAAYERALGERQH